MRLFVPTLGSLITLSAPWTFTLKKEGRNASLMKVTARPHKPEDEKPPTLAQMRKRYQGYYVGCGGRTITDDELWWKYREVRFYSDEDIITAANRPIEATERQVWQPGPASTLDSILGPIHMRGRHVTERTPARARTDAEVKAEIQRLTRERAKQIKSHAKYEAENHSYKSSPEQQKFTLPAHTVLKVDRVYIRGTSEDYRRFDSLTFRIKACPEWKDCQGARFFASLSDVNTIDFELGQCEFLSCLPQDVRDEEEI